MKSILSMILAVAMVVGTGCCMRGKPCGKKPAPTPAAAKPCMPVAECGDSGCIKIVKILPPGVSVSKTFDYKILVKNSCGKALADVQVVETLPAGYEFKSAAPTAKSSGNQLTWEIPLLEADATKELIVTGLVKTQGTFQSCATASYKLPACAQFVATMPDVTIAKSATASAGFCDPITLKYVAMNKGTGAASGLVITDTLGDGLTTLTGEKNININVGTLAAGQTRTFTIGVKPTKTGSFGSKAMLKGTDINVESGSTTTTVVRPALKITQSAPKMVYLGRDVTFSIKVDNEGDGAADNSIIEATLPAGAKFVSATNGGLAFEGKVVWKLGQLAPKASKTVEFTCAPTTAGTVETSAKALASCSEAVTAAAAADVKGIPAVLLEVVDVSDPIELGQLETYTILVTNQGSAPATNITVKAVLEDTMEYNTSMGATSGSFADKTVTFAPLASLAPKAQAKWVVKVKAIKAGDVRFKVMMKTDQLERDVEETESTTFYE